ncbi:TPA: DUF4291 domain-containing protein [Escherichia coli]|uniref:DUF4291 domain-containing protein n=1 Tax=Escherichia coli TaxID=562 RepID=UPI00183980D9|nr:DUF4291 domain-containing protein [Escherichia coli]EES4957729.1 DUF4291 domain-containing protein [Escherichia coli]EES6102267.1 DUF4291 domain-containing protein [Escherichia coli]EES6552041.1 DUF4291 domain-containing protein [Escherichia coli]EFM3342456.1 DUF4291 domain-containing protein [Escherichia coli]EFM8090692.1 DUF4291 domain-containing protein [Escherichia coli]
MADYFEIRADYNQHTITIYQAYNDAIADVAVRDGRFGAPFSFNRMTWIKPSFMWMMERSNWGLKKDQQHILAIRIKRTFFDTLLEQAVLTTPVAHVYPHAGIWETLFAQANVYVQWDPERSINGKKLEHRSLQLGISRNLISQFNEDAIVAIDDLTPLVRKCHNLLINGKTTQAKSFLPPEKIYPVSAAARKALGMKNS